MKRHSQFTLAVVATLSLGTTGFVVPQALATSAADNVVISEVYGGGGNSGATLRNDFIELYNPTDQPISLEGWTVQYESAKGSKGGSAQLTGTIQPNSHFLIKAAPGNGGTVDFTADAEATGIAMSGKDGAVTLSDGTSTVDTVGYGAAVTHETAAAPQLSNSTSASRDEAGTDTDNNSTDFTSGNPAPQFSGGNAVEDPGTDPEEPTDPEDPTDPQVPTDRVSIEEIQGTGAATPLQGKTVTTAGWVTASYPEGGLNGFTIQMGGAAEESDETQASRAVFVYTGAGKAPADLGKCVIVTGNATEFKGSTQLAHPTFQESENPQEDCGAAVEPNTGDIPTDPEQREANEHMLFQPEATYTVTNNYELNTYGSVDLVAGETPLLQATSVVNPGPEAVAYEEENQRKVISMDDGSTANFLRNKDAQRTPLPYLSTAEGIQSLRTGDQVSFSNPVVLSYNFEKWGLQPTGAINGQTAREKLPISWEDSRPAEAKGPAAVGGTHSIASFNVLNYFTSLGEDEAQCEGYEDMNGQPVTANYCDVRGAYTQSAFEDQQAKIVSAINTLDVSVLGLEEIQNSAAFGQDRDAALQQLVEALNAAGGNWKYVPSPKNVPADEDVIRTAFIYRDGAVEPVGESKILDHEAFNGIARQPLAQRFKAVGAEDSESFVAVVNHYKSKGSVARGDADSGDGQGNNANLRTEMSRQLIAWLGSEEEFKDRPQFILGDLNAYAREDAVRVIEEAGYVNVEKKFDAGHSYQFGGRLGSLDHVLANEEALKMITGADVWDINSDESVAFEYSRRHYNVVDFYSEDPFRSSDHDPIKVGFNLGGTVPEQPGSGDQSGSVPGSSKTGLIAGIIATIMALLAGGLGIHWLQQQAWLR